MIQVSRERTGEAAVWNDLIAGLPNAHLLQTWEWAQVKAEGGWQPVPLVWRDETGRVRAAALVLERAAGAGLKVLYVPRGPLLDWKDETLRRQVIADLQTLARQRGAVFLKLDPEVTLWTGIPETEGAVPSPSGEALLAELKHNGWRFSEEQIQFRNTVWINLAYPEDVLLANMKQKTRYNIRLAQRKGVVVRQGGLEDLPLLYRMYAETSVRDGFVIRGEAYYLRVWQTFMEAGMATPLLAEVEGEAIAALVLFHFGESAWYLHGMSREVQRNLMPTYLLQWEAMRRAQALGCTRYDLWGAPDVFDESDSMWGVFRFKQGLGGEVICTLGAWDYPARPVMYRLYTQVLPRVLDVMRRRGRQRTAKTVSR